MDYLQAIVIAIIQGISEWLPISSTAHLAAASQIMQVEPSLFYYALLHFASVIALVWYFRKEVPSYFIQEKKLTSQGLYVILATIPLGVAGVVFYEQISAMFTNFSMMGIALIINGTVLFFTRFCHGQHTLTLPRALTVGLAQVVALIPGISRSGITVSTGFFSGMKRETIVLFSMMLSLPAVLGAAVYEAFTTSMQLTLPMLVGCVVAAIAAYITLGFLITRIRNGEFYKYWLYCVAIGVIFMFN